MGTEHRVDIARTALYMQRIPKQKLIKQYKDYKKIFVFEYYKLYNIKYQKRNYAK